MDPFVARQMAYLGVMLLALGLVGWSTRRHPFPHLLGFSVGVQGIVLVAVSAIASSARVPDEFLLIVIVLGGVTATLLGPTPNSDESEACVDGVSSPDRRVAGSSASGESRTDREGNSVGAARGGDAARGR